MSKDAKMRFIVEKKLLASALGHVQRAVERRNTIPILANVLMAADAGVLTLTTTDLDLQITEKFAAEVSAAGTVTVPAHLLYDIIRKMPDGAEISAEVEDGMVALKSGRSRFKLQTLPAEDFPTLTIGDFPHVFEMTGAALRHLISMTEFAISTEETRYYLNGIYLHTIKAGNRKLLCAVATDGHRLAKATTEAPAGAEELSGVIVPRKAIGEIARLMEGAETAKVELSDTKIRITIGDAILTSKLIDGTFPDYGRVIPQSNALLATVDVRAMAAAVDRVASIASERGRAVKLSFTAGRLEVSVSSPDHGTGTEDIEIDYSGDDLQIGFNSRYLADVLGAVDADKASIKLADAGSPTLFTGDGSTESLFVLMPMRV